MKDHRYKHVKQHQLSCVFFPTAFISFFFSINDCSFKLKVIQWDAECVSFSSEHMFLQCSTLLNQQLGVPIFLFRWHHLLIAYSRYCMVIHVDSLLLDIYSWFLYIMFCFLKPETKKSLVTWSIKTTVKWFTHPPKTALKGRIQFPTAAWLKSTNQLLNPQQNDTRPSQVS